MSTPWSASSAVALILAVAHVVPIPAGAGVFRVFLLAGQSNMEGVGLVSEAPSNLLSQTAVRLYHSPAVRARLPADRWHDLVPAGVGPAHFGPELTLGATLSSAFPGERVALIKHARGGTKLTTDALNYKTTTGWHPGTNAADTASFGAEFALFVHTVTNALAALRAQGDEPVLGGLFWVQGEADSTSIKAGADYGANFANFVRRVREQFAAPDLPVVCARILPCQVRPGSAAVRQALTDADQDSGKPAALSRVFMVPTEGLGINADQVHFNARGQLDLGRRLAEALLARGHPRAGR